MDNGKNIPDENSLVIRDEYMIDGQESPTGPAHPFRGIYHHKSAMAFADRWPVGSKLTTNDLAQWGKENGHISFDGELPQPPNLGEPASHEWRSLQQITITLIKSLNKAASHDRFIKSGYIPYEIKSDKPNWNHWNVVSISEAIHKWDYFERAFSQAVALHKKHRYRLEGMDWPRENYETREKAEAQYLEEDIFIGHIEHLMGDFKRRLKGIEKRRALKNKRMLDGIVPRSKHLQEPDESVDEDGSITSE